MSSKPRILIIDPDRKVHSLFIGSMQPWFEVYTATTLSDGLALLRAHQPHIVLLEVRQSDGNGLDWIRYIRSQSWGQRLVLVCHTTLSGVRDKVNGFRVGADDYLVKPVDPERLPAHLRLLLRIRPLTITQSITHGKIS
jgi:two-component system response regulator ResD